LARAAVFAALRRLRTVTARFGAAVRTPPAGIGHDRAGIRRGVPATGFLSATAGKTLTRFRLPRR
jgi:hypothetical protein